MLLTTKSTCLRSSAFKSIQFCKILQCNLHDLSPSQTSIQNKKCLVTHKYHPLTFTRLKSDLTKSKKSNGQVSTRTEKVKQATKDVSYSLVILIGVIVTGGVLFVLYRELLSKSGPTKIFSDALEECRRNDEVCVALGTPIEGYGEMTSRKRRRHVSHLAYIDSQGRNAMRMKFYVKGSSGRTGTIQLDAVIKNREIKYRYLMAHIDTYPPRTMIVKDQRSEIDLYCEDELLTKLPDTKI